LLTTKPVSSAKASSGAHLPSRVDLALLCGITPIAVLIHGYHPTAEDAEIYLPGILKLVHPSLFPRNAAFFQSHAGLTLFPNLIADSIQFTHVPDSFALLAWHLLSIFLMLWASWRIASLCFLEKRAVWCAVGVVACLLTMPVAGTALYLMDQYLTPRSLSTPLALHAVAWALERRYLRSSICAAAIGAIHPLMAVFAIGWVFIFIAVSNWPGLTARVRSRLKSWRLTHGPVPEPETILPLALFPAISPAYRQALLAHPYFLLSNWEWYEWLGIVGPFIILAGFARLARRTGNGTMRLVCQSLMVFEAAFFTLSLFISLPGRFERFSEIQPLRCLHLVYCVFLVLAGGLVGKYLLVSRPWRWMAFFLLLSAPMFCVQRQLFAATPHLEIPGVKSDNPWVEAFDWIRWNTPDDAFFAIDPEYSRSDDEQGFRALAQRSMLADDGKDGGAVSMFPALAEEWQSQLAMQRNWRYFGTADLARLRRDHGVTWVVLPSPGRRELSCPYRNSQLAVCRLR
jgi:hypothetical protein